MYSGIKYLDYPAMTYRRQVIAEYQVGFPIRKSAGQRVLSPNRGLSQSATSFIASYRQGIHQTPFSRLIRASERMTFCCAAHSKMGKCHKQHHASASARREATCESSRMTPLATKPIHTFTSLIIPSIPTRQRGDRLVSACIPCRRKVCS